MRRRRFSGPPPPRADRALESADALHCAHPSGVLCAGEPNAELIAEAELTDEHDSADEALRTAAQGNRQLECFADRDEAPGEEAQPWTSVPGPSAPAPAGPGT